VSTFTDGNTKTFTISLINIAKVGARALQSDEEPSELLKESLDILQDGIECVCPDNAGKFLTFGVKAIKVALSDNSEETLRNGLCLAEEAANTFTDGKMKHLTSSLINIAKVGARALQQDSEPSELLKESLDILQDGIEHICPDNAGKYVAFGVKAMKVALCESNEETLRNGLCLAEEAVSTFTDGNTKTFTISLINIAKVGARALQSDEEPSELLKESLDILQDGIGCVCPNNAGKFLTFGVKAIKVALSDNSEETLRNGLCLAEEAANTFTNGKMKHLTSSLINIAKVCARALKPDSEPSELLKESLDIL
jgi:translation elongation factor EF-1beta